MNKTIQSSSYRGYEESLLDSWIDQIGTVSASSTSFLLNNLQTCLLQFKTFVSDFETEAENLEKFDKDFQNLSNDSKKKANFDLWRKEKVRKALDVYWAPLSQAATQYTSPAYKKALAEIVDMEQDIKNCLEKTNQLAGVSGNKAITIGDILLFFDELTLIRLAPYWKTALIGIPFRVTDSTSDPDASKASKESQLSGIAHELGHFLYWRLADFDQIEQRHSEIAASIRASLIQILPKNEALEVRFVNAWLEELFADFVGASIAGEKYIRSTKDMIIRNNKAGEYLDNNDQEHVSDILRPLVSIYTVNRNREDALKNWKDFFTDQYPVDTSTLSIKAFREDDNQKDIERAPDELADTLIHAIDILADKLGSAAKDPLFVPDFSKFSKASEIAAKAIRLAEAANKEKEPEEDQDSPLDYFLEPQTLEGGQQSHGHWVKTTDKGSHHGNNAFWINHT